MAARLTESGESGIEEEEENDNPFGMPEEYVTPRMKDRDDETKQMATTDAKTENDKTTIKLNKNPSENDIATSFEYMSDLWRFNMLSN